MIQFILSYIYGIILLKIMYPQAKTNADVNMIWWMLVIMLMLPIILIIEEYICCV